jgi:hypothetical protein
MTPRRTIAHPVTATGTALHAGVSVTMTCSPAASGSGIVFRRADLKADIAALYSNVGETRLGTVLEQGDTKVGVVEHLMAAAAGLVFWLKSLDGPVPGPLSPSAVAPGAHSLLIGRYAADTCGDAGAGVVLCVLARSELAELELSPPRRLVRLTRGTAVASVASQPADTSFSLVTERAHVTSAGATFSVDVGEQGETAVRVHEGTVQVRAAGSTTATVLGEGQAFVLGAEKIQTVSTHERERDLRLLSDAKADAP